MKRLLSGVLGIFLSTQGYAGDFSRLYVFGDSLSDAGNLHIALLQQGIGGLPGEYSKSFYPIPLGRASNGPVAMEYVANQLGLQALPSFLGGTNYAFIGAKAQMDHDAFPFDFPAQVYALAGKLQASGAGLQESDLVTVMIGANDIRSAIETVAVTQNMADAEQQIDQAIASVRQQLGFLRSLGARNWLLVNAPELEASPYIQELMAQIHPSAKKQVKELTKRFNTQFEKLVRELELQGSGQVRFFDIYHEAHVIQATSFAAGFTNRTDTCWSQADGYVNGCSVAASFDYFYFDNFHPSTRIHKQVADRILEALQ
ncbi:MAG TPA: SGNH/GDSL hydrolase family protein [Oligoflexus sp.]|uniref:SGNH/GDSL hydrolase family protein n=1 Tax=Oligoflexus sp. TaxID=1971216 RepID=UPI002D7F36F9|nr:SGNH/GDSL hydrolase family protein [Oligoflexus sp.]HET9241384.1 SGNH/GDSL hydrolase family protein [Oligoflexus sp.]